MVDTIDSKSIDYIIMRVQVSLSVNKGNNMILKFDKYWFSIIYNEFEKPYFKALFKFLKKKKYSNIYPDKKHIFKSLQDINFKNVNVVFLGQDPYCEEGQANGLAFSVNNNKLLPGSLKNICKELNDDLDVQIKKNNIDLNYLSKQGILLLNSTLTVEKNKPNSHQEIGWQNLTDKIIKTLSTYRKNIIFVLLGKNAINKIKIINIDKNIIITASHPSPLSANKGFFKSRIFTKINLHLKLLGKNKIKW